eukprot:5924653-Pyramimonas_sp.AAC.1
MSSAPGVARQVADRILQHGFKACTVLEILGMEARDGVKVQYTAIRQRMAQLKRRLPRFRRMAAMARIGRAIAQPSIGVRRA